MKDLELFEGLKKLEKRLEEFPDTTEVSDIDIMLEVNTSLQSPKQKGKYRKKLIEEGFIDISGGKDDKNSSVNEVYLGKFRQERDIRQHDPRDYFTESIHGNEKFDAEKTAEEIMSNHRFLKVEGKEKGLKIYKEGVWKEEQYAVETIEREVNERLGQETSSRYRSNVNNIIKNHRDIQIGENNFDHPKMLIPFANGVYDLKDDELKDYRPELHFTFKYEAEYKPELENNAITEFFEDIAPESKEKRKKLHEIAAMAIAPWRVKELMPILFGKGSNGKNSYVDIIKEILGSENYHISSSRKISEDKFESTAIHQSQLLFLDEFEEASSPNALKRLTDHEQNIRGMHKEPGTIETSVQPIFTANELPSVNEDSEGFYRRWQIINFNQKFTDEEENDGNPNKLERSEFEDKYLSNEAIDAYATSLVEHLKDLVDTGRLTDQQSRSKVRAIWEEKASAVYHFIDKFLTQGKVEYADESKVGDYIIKKEMTKLVNSYLDEKNLSKTNTQHITRALEKHPDIEVNSSARPRPGDGLDPQQPTAYEGVRIRDDRVHDIRRVLPLYAWRSPELLRLTNHRKYLDITKNDKTAIALEFLKQCGEDGAHKVELIKELNLTPGESVAIDSCEYIQKDSIEEEGALIPLYKLDEDRLEEELDNADVVVDKDGKPVRPMTWLKDEIDSWSQETRKEKEEVIQRGKATGFSGEAVESALENLQDDGVLYEPHPNRVQKL